jgi:hypothetical protein
MTVSALSALSALSLMSVSWQVLMLVIMEEEEEEEKDEAKNVFLVLFAVSVSDSHYVDLAKIFSVKAWL